MAANVIIASSVKVEVKSGSAFVKLGGVTDFDGIGGGSAPEIDTSDFDSVAAEFAQGLPDEGEFTFNYNAITDDAGQAALVTLRAARTTTDWKLTVGNQLFAFTGFVKTNKLNGAKGEKVTGAVTVRISGAIVRTKVS